MVSQVETLVKGPECISKARGAVQCAHQPSIPRLHRGRFLALFCPSTAGSVATRRWQWCPRSHKGRWRKIQLIHKGYAGAGQPWFAGSDSEHPSHVCIQGWHVGSLKSATAGVICTMGISKYYKPRFFSPESQFTSISCFHWYTGKGFLSQAYKAKSLDSQVRPGFDRWGWGVTNLSDCGFPLTRSNINTITSQGCYMD